MKNKVKGNIEIQLQDYQTFKKKKKKIDNFSQNFFWKKIMKKKKKKKIDNFSQNFFWKIIMKQISKSKIYV